jgi:hypothetical protein
MHERTQSILRSAQLTSNKPDEEISLLNAADSANSCNDTPLSINDLDEEFPVQTSSAQISIKYARRKYKNLQRDPEITMIKVS